LDVVLGDARLSLERELARNEPQDFDLLALDAFSGEAIPIHLLTKEAFAIYLRHLKKPGGILAVHISNLYLDLRPVVCRAAQQFGLEAAWIHSADEDRASRTSDWILLADSKDILNVPEIVKARAPWDMKKVPANLWTDDYSSILLALKR
jgi:hypothetical protein